VNIFSCTSKQTYKMKLISLAFFIVLSSSKIFCQWSELGGNYSLKAYDYVKDFEINSKNEIFTIGLFQSNNYFDSLKQRFILKFDGLKWNSINSLTDYSVLKNISNIEIDKNDNIYIVNAYQKDSGYYFIGKYDGTNFFELKGLKFPQNKLEKVLFVDNSNNVYIGGKSINDNEFFVYWHNGIKWDTLISYKNLGDVNWIANIVRLKSNELVFNVRLNNGQYKIILLKNNVPTIIGSFNNYVSNLILGRNDKLYAGGQFRKNNSSTYISVYEDTTWKVLGDSTWSYSPFSIDAIHYDKNHNVYTICGPTSAENYYKLAKFNGLNWSYFKTYNRNEYMGSKIVSDDKNSLFINSYSRNDSLLFFISKFDLNYSNINSSDKKECEVYPNPFQNYLRVSLSKVNKQTIVLISDYQGRVLKNENYNNKNEIEINLDFLLKGNYILSISTEDQVIIKRITKN
jgi:hypothetical protein